MNSFDYFLQAESEAQIAELRDTIVGEGYPAFYRFLDRFKTRIKTFNDNQAEEVKALIAKAREAVPDPGLISPSWTHIWDRLEQMTDYKAKVLQSVSPEERSGEWQILIDNPYTNREVACYPGLSFTDAAYIYAQFRPDLEFNEYIRLQKIQTHVTEYGKQRED